jgi:predicted metal-binding membrane protein
MLLTWRRERNVILALLLVLAALAWAFLIWSPMARPSAGAMGLTMGMTAAVFLSIWVVMMVAMMFPTAAPMILAFARVHESRREQGRAFVPTWVFVSAYLLVWTLFGVAAYVLALLAESAAQRIPWLLVNGPRIGGILLVLAGLYQLSPLKHVCLSKCRMPLDFILHSWRSGYGGSLRMGLEHAGYCVGCCWLLFLILFPLGVMNVAVMVVITLLIFAEKSLPVGIWVGRLAAVALIGFGAVTVVLPALLPMLLMGKSGM